MAATPNKIITPQALKANTAVATTANSTYSDTPTNTVALITAGPNGAQVTKITAIPRASIVTNPTEAQLYRDGDGTGTAKRLFNSKAMPVYAVSQTSGNTPTDFGYYDSNVLRLAPNEKVWVAIGVSNTGIVFSAEWQDF